MCVCCNVLPGNTPPTVCIKEVALTSLVDSQIPTTQQEHFRFDMPKNEFLNSVQTYFCVCFYLYYKLISDMLLLLGVQCVIRSPDMSEVTCVDNMLSSRLSSSWDRLSQFYIIGGSPFGRDECRQKGKTVTMTWFTATTDRCPTGLACHSLKLSNSTQLRSYA